MAVLPEPVVTITRRAYFPGGLLPDAVREAWVDWCTRHRIDPARIPDTGWIEVNDATCTVRALVLVHDLEGRIVSDGNNGIARTETLVRLSEPPAPFPEVQA